MDRQVQARKCATVAKRIIQAAELACYGSLRLIHTSCHTSSGQKSRMVDRSRINHYIDIIILPKIPIVLLHWKSLITKKWSRINYARPWLIVWMM